MESWGFGGVDDGGARLLVEVVVEVDMGVGAYLEDPRPPVLLVLLDVLLFVAAFDIDSEEKELVSEGDRLLTEAKRRSSCSRFRAHSFM